MDPVNPLDAAFVAIHAEYAAEVRAEAEAEARVSALCDQMYTTADRDERDALWRDIRATQDARIAHAERARLISRVYEVAMAAVERAHAAAAADVAAVEKNAVLANVA